jgi:hypothetical protein
VPPSEQRPIGRSLPRRTPGAAAADWPTPNVELPAWPDELLTQVNVDASPLTDRRITAAVSREPWEWAPTSRRRSRWLPAGIILVVALILAGLLVWHELSHHAKGQAAATPAASFYGPPGPPPGNPPPRPRPFANVGWLCPPSAPPDANGVPPSQPQSATGPLPNEWKWFNGLRGYRVPVPQSWQFVPGDPTTCFYDPLGYRFLFVNEWTDTGRDPVAALTSREAELSAPDGMPFYHHIHIMSVACAAKCAELEFTFDGPHGPLHGIVWDYLDPNGQAYAVTWMTGQATWTSNLPNLSIVLKRFAPVHPLG